MSTSPKIADLPLHGSGGEPVLVARTLASHGVASLPPARIDEGTWTLETTLAVPRGARTVRVRPADDDRASVEVVAGSTPPRVCDALVAQLRHMFRLDDDLSPFYAVARDDADLAWAADGAGRMLRSPTV